eukprot:TRINITY_DN2514_c0_g1_i2.p1 TRINITY_DN2514_c0_g1~~TRINITY_DN2514_c0_g1_i2.p1  ORF type:complete len:135 (-),score=26.16 TRINITY_DN2514_c0_g1_i2:167-571(-)
MKRRAVKREIPDLFKDCTVVSLCKDHNYGKQLESLLAMYGAALRKNITKRTKYVVIPKKDVPYFTTDLETAKKFQVTIVSDQFIIAIISAGTMKNIDASDYEIDLNNPVNIKKRKKPVDVDDEDTSEDEPKKKK